MSQRFANLKRLFCAGLSATAIFLGFIQVSHANELEQGEWWVRLIAEAPEDQLIDRGNVLGWLKDSRYRYDRHDLMELSPPSKTPYLTIVFPRYNWGERSGNYASDFHRRKHWRKGDRWRFLVKSDIPRKVTLSWEGYDGIRRMYRMRLVDLESGKIVRAIRKKNLQTYTFTMTGKTHRFRWVYLERPNS